VNSPGCRWVTDPRRRSRRGTRSIMGRHFREVKAARVLPVFVICTQPILTGRPFLSIPPTVRTSKIMAHTLGSSPTQGPGPRSRICPPTPGTYGAPQPESKQSRVMALPSLGKFFSILLIFFEINILRILLRRILARDQLRYAAWRLWQNDLRMEETRLRCWLRFFGRGWAGSIPTRPTTPSASIEVPRGETDQVTSI
jgi:hypothetical protein